MVLRTVSNPYGAGRQVSATEFDALFFCDVLTRAENRFVAENCPRIVERSGTWIAITFEQLFSVLLGDPGTSVAVPCMNGSPTIGGSVQVPGETQSASVKQLRVCGELLHVLPLTAI